MAFDFEAAFQRALATPTNPSKRSVKNKSGRTGRKQYNAQQDLKAVGGYANHVRAIYCDAHSPSVPYEMCKVVSREVPGVGDPRSNPDLPEYRPTGSYGYVGRVGSV